MTSHVHTSLRLAEADISELVEAEQPYTEPRYDWCGRASTDQAALRTERPTSEGII
jgi:hypothetical protein